MTTLAVSNTDYIPMHNLLKYPAEPGGIYSDFEKPQTFIFPCVVAISFSLNQLASVHWVPLTPTCTRRTNYDDANGAFSAASSLGFGFCYWFESSPWMEQSVLQLSDTAIRSTRHHATRSQLLGPGLSHMQEFSGPFHNGIVVDRRSAFQAQRSRVEIRSGDVQLRQIPRRHCIPFSFSNWLRELPKSL